jgi:type IV pilus assembly protein PilM
MWASYWTRLIFDNEHNDKHMNSALLYKDKPIFGLDIGFSNLKVMQIGQHNKKHVVTGYGVTTFDAAAITDGVITDPEAIAKVAHQLFDRNIIGDITTRRVAIAIPAARTYNRTVQLPKLTKKELQEAIRSEAEQYISLPIDQLYIDYEIITESADGIEVLISAAPSKVVRSYIQLMDMMGLEVVALETTIGAGSRLFVQAEASDVPTVLIDFGSISSDITIYDKALIVTGTVPGGGDTFTKKIASTLGVTEQEAHVIKTKYGLGLSKKQKEIVAGLTPDLESLLKEIRRMIRYYEERSHTERKISQVVTMGGGANMPGLSEFMTSHLRLPVRMCDPWQRLEFGDLQPPSTIEKSMYVTVAGLALMEPKEIFA